MDIIAIAQEVHQTSMEHGWWEGEHDPREKIALIHSELSEALEEARNGRPMLYSNPQKPDKPEGIGVELIDCVIRILDFMVHYDVPYAAKSRRMLYDVESDEPSILIYKLHAVLYACVPESPNVPIDFDTGKICDTEELGLVMSRAIDMIFSWIRAHGASPESILREKADYNKGRSYKHGGKAF